MKDLKQKNHILNKELDDQLFCTKSMAKLLGVSTQWLEIGRTKGYGPPFLKLTNRMIRYRASEVKAWLDTKMYNNTSEYADMAEVHHGK